MGSCHGGLDFDLDPPAALQVKDWEVVWKDDGKDHTRKDLYIKCNSDDCLESCKDLTNMRTKTIDGVTYIHSKDFVKLNNCENRQFDIYKRYYESDRLYLNELVEIIK